MAAGEKFGQMNDPHATQTRHAENGRRVQALIALAAIVALALGLRLYRIGAESVCLEEYVSACHLDEPDLISFVKAVKAHYPYGAPLAFIIEYLWAGVVGDSMARVRLVFVLAGMLLMPVTYLFAREIYGNGALGRRAGLLAALCVALSPVHRFYAQEARMYAFLALFALIAMYSLSRAVREGGTRWWVVNILANFCVMWTHLFGVLLLVAEGLFLLIFGLRNTRKTLAWFALHFVLCVPLAIWVMSIPRQPDALYSFYHPVTLRFLFWDLFGDDVVSVTTGFPIAANPWAFFPATFSTHLAAVHRWFDWALVGVSCASVLWLMWRLVRVKRRAPNGAQPLPDARGLVLLAMWLVVPVFTLGVLSHAWAPCYSQRFTLYTSLALFLMIGGAVASVSSRWMRNAAACLVAALYGYQLLLVLPGPTRADWKSAAAFIRASGSPNDLILVQEPLWMPIFLFNAPGVPNPVSSAYTTETLCEQADFFLQEHARSEVAQDRRPGVWVVFLWRLREFEKRLPTRGLSFTCREFSGGRHVVVYRVQREGRAVPPVAGVPVAGPSMNALAEAIAERSAHPAAAAFREAIENAAGSSAAFTRLAIALAEKGAVNAAAAALRRAVQFEPRLAVDLTDLQVALTGEGDYETAFDVAAEGVRSGRGDLEALMELLAVLHGKGSYDKVLELSRRAIERDPSYATAYSYLGIALQQKGDLDQAIEAFRKALELDPDQGAGTYIGLGTLLKRKGEHEAACRVLRQGTSRHPDEPWLHAHLGMALLEKGDYDSGVAALSSAVELEPADANIWMILGETHVAKGDYASAIPVLHKAIALDPADAWRHWTLWRAYAGQGDLDAAMSTINRAFDLDPRLAAAWRRLISAVYETKDYDAAWEEVRKLRAEQEAIPPELMRKLARDSGRNE